MQHGPCDMSTQWLHAFISVVTAVQAIGVAYLTHRAIRKNREDRDGNGHRRH